jgi:hypothetical protein
MRDLEDNGRHTWLRYADWAATYGDVVYLEIFGTSMVILNSYKATTDLFEKRSANYSDRPGASIFPFYDTSWTESRRDAHGK